MKKAIAIALLSFILCINFNTIFAATSQYYYNTDIVAYINDLPIKSYNISGYTGIIAEDLAKHKFRVNYYDEYRLLTVDYVESDLSEITADYTPEPATKPVGSIAGKIYKTDIQVKLDGEYVKGYNIGGKTIILIDELDVYGDVVWHPDERKICYTHQKSWNYEIETDREVEQGKSIDGFSFNLSRDKQEYNIIGENLNYLDYLKIGNTKKNGLCLSFSLYQRVLFETENLSSILIKCINTDYEGRVIQQDTSYTNQHIKIYVNNEPASIYKVVQGKGNGHSDYYIYLDCNIKENDFNNMKVVVE